jgi:ribosomal protein S18 acetylase RimI-like enzyme
MPIENHRIVGYITAYARKRADFWQVKRVGVISGLMVHQDYRKMGIGRELLSQARDFFISLGLKYFTLYTAVSNQQAIDFYLKNGMSPL